MTLCSLFNNQRYIDWQGFSAILLNIFASVFEGKPVATAFAGEFGGNSKRDYRNFSNDFDSGIQRSHLWSIFFCRNERLLRQVQVTAECH